MSLEWRKKHCPKIHHPKSSQPKNVVGRVYWCPVHPDFLGSCFEHCNLNSEQVCGNCVHWYGHCTTEPIDQPKFNSNGRHRDFGFCSYQIDNVGAKWHNDCPHFYKRPENFDWAMPDWVEDQLEQNGFYLEVALTRKARKEVREQWFRMWE